jgi:hypothetical protein
VSVTETEWPKVPEGAGTGPPRLLGALSAYHRELAVLERQLLQAQGLLVDALAVLPGGATRERIERWLGR